MILHLIITTSFLVTATFFPSVHALQNISRVGRYLFNEDGSRFYIKGIAYQPQGVFLSLSLSSSSIDPTCDPSGAVSSNANSPFSEPDTFIDPVANGTACQRDLSFLQELGVNVVRFYSVDSTLDHSDCMNMFANANIYAMCVNLLLSFSFITDFQYSIDLSLPLNGSFNRDAPTWQTNLLDQYLETIRVFSQYPNVIVYNVGNEVVTAPDETPDAPFIKAAAREIKAYL